MASDSSQQSMHEERPAKPPVAYPKNGAAPLGVDPELLRWRAEVLLDEMMLGGVDVAAGEPLSRHAWPSTATPSPAATLYENGWEAATAAHENGHHTANGVSRPQSGPGDEVGSSGDEPKVRPASSQPTRNTWPPDNEPTATPDSKSWVLSAEERYRQLARQQEATPPAKTPAEPAINAAGDYLWPEANHASAHTDPTTTMATPSVQRVANQFAGTIASASAKRSNLLPRMSTLDAETAQREIYTLKHEIDGKLPAGHDAHTRAHHLLDRALEILQADPLRSAEVEYYLQQVRTIFQRVQQTLDWSTVYRKRLFIYLVGWLLLTLLVLIACLLYWSQIEAFVALFGGITAGGIVAPQVVMVMAAAFAGALGGAFSGLTSLYHQSYLPHGFVDRKFGLRGLVLPLLGAIVGGLLASLFGVGYALLGVNPSQTVLAILVPTLLAFVFGVSQESIYGTRE
jgi:hypothetical protein